MKLPRRHSCVLNTKQLEVDQSWVLQTPRRRQSIVQSPKFNNLSFGQYDEAGVDNLMQNDLSDSEAEFTDSEEEEYSNESEGSERMTPEFVYLKTLFCPDPNDDLVDWDTFSKACSEIDTEFFTAQLVSVFKIISPQKHPAPFSNFVNFFSDTHSDPLIEFHRKQMYNSILKAFKSHVPEPDPNGLVAHEESSTKEDDFEDVSLETLRQRCVDQKAKIDDLEVELESQRVENISMNDRCRHLEKKISLLKDGERLHTHVILLRAMIRNGEDVKSKRLRIMPAGATVRICKIRGNRAQIDFPIKGWCSVFAQDGRPILQSLNSEDKMEATPGLFLERQESESESFRPNVKRGHEDTREHQERGQLESLLLRIQALEFTLDELARSKILLVQSTSREIDRLSHLIIE